MTKGRPISPPISLPASRPAAIEPAARAAEPRGAEERWSWKLEPPGPALRDYFTGPQRP